MYIFIFVYFVSYPHSLLVRWYITHSLTHSLITQMQCPCVHVSVHVRPSPPLPYYFTLHSWSLPCSQNITVHGLTSRLLQVVLSTGCHCIRDCDAGWCMPCGLHAGSPSFIPRNSFSLCSLGLFPGLLKQQI